MVSLNQLEVLVAVVEAGGFSGAAKAMYLSQPSVSNHVRNLESSLGVRLVERTTAGARTTPAGDVVVDHARRIFGLLDSLEQEVASYRGLGAGRLLVAGTTTLGTYLLPRLVADFSSRAPNVDCQIRVGNEQAVEEWIVRGEATLGLCIDEPREHLESEPLLEDEIMLVAGPGSRLAGRVLEPGDLRGQRFLLRERGSATRRLQEEILHAWGLESEARWELWGPETLKEAAAEGLGVALLSEHVTVRERAAGQLVALRVEPAPPRRTVSLVRRGDRVLTPPEEAFVAMLRSLGSWPG
ncbi:selenium metabolism-associated LysR family transcriptional regulator [Isoptericola hypogeus]|uniref:Selenium metabolism-associated LysR family transcriptional regulator n=1 Tax=Isoptericola hypogeus TaxID=300179 RepID=A0ABP4VN80_9MICO